LTVKTANGAIADPISVDGGAASYSLVLTGGTATSDIYSVGPNPGQGTSTIVIGGVTQMVSFTGLEPVVDLVAGPLVINATAANNAITYTQGGAAANGLVTIDNFESIEFSNKTTLTLDAGTGDDDIRLNNASTPTSLTSILVDAGDLADKDTLTVNGVTGMVDSFLVSPIATGSGTVTKLSAPQPAVTFSDLEALSIVGQNVDLDAVQYAGTANNDTYQYTAGATPDAGSITGFSASGPVFVPLSFAGIRGFVTLGSGLGNGTAGGADTLVINGASGDDLFRAPDAAAGFAAISINTGANLHTPVRFDSTAGVASVLLRGVEGNDRFDLDFNPLVPAAAGIAIRVEGGDGTDVINHTANTDAATTIDLGLGSVASTGANTVTFAGVETINQASSGPAATLSVLGTANDDTLNYTPATATSGSVVLASTGLAVNFTGLVGALNLSGAAGSDTIAVSGNAAANTIAVSGAAVAVDALKAANVSAESLRVLGLAGSDLFNVTPGATPIFIDGGDPVGVLPGDQLNIISGGGVVNFNVGPENDEGSIVVGALQPVNFDHIESIGAIVGSPVATINGTNGDDDITIIARDSSFNALADGVQDFTVSVNGAPTLLFINTPTIVVNALGGSDDISIQAPAAAPVGPWNVGITVNGGLPTGSDTVIFGTPGADTVQYTPTGADTGTLNIVNLLSVTNLVGIEHLVYDGEGGNDALTINTTGGDDRIVHTPGTQTNAGNVAVGSLLAIGYQNIGLAGSLTVSDAGGNDVLVVEGTAGNDTFAKTGTGGVVLQNGAGTHLAVQSTGVEQVTLAGLAGSDLANLTGGGTAVALAGLGSPSSNISGGGLGIVNLDGVETLNLNAASAVLTVSTTAGDDTLDVSPTGANAATLAANGVSPLVNVSNVATLAIDTLGGDDLLRARYTSNPETIDVNVPAATIGVSVGGPLLGLSFAGVDAIEVYGEQGNDTFNVTPGLNIPVFIDGGDPIGATAGDRIVILGGLSSIFEPGPENDEGGFNFGAAAERVSFDHIEAVTVVNTACVIVQGTNADDDITIIARDQSYIVPPAPVPAGLDGVQDFTVSVNNGLEILYINATMLYVDALAGDDDIVLRTPAPNGAVWDVDVWVAGGTPSAVTGDQGDVFELETPGQQTLSYTPTGSDSGVIDITTLSSIITLGTFVDACPPLNYDSSVGGLEEFVYDGEGANDLLTLIGTGLDDTIVHTPGSAGDEGTLRVNNLLGIRYQNLGAPTGTITVDGGAGGIDRLVYDGTDGNDSFSVAASGAVDLTNTAGNHVDLAVAGVEGLTLNAKNGDDTFTINGAPAIYTAGITVAAGDPSGSDVATLVGTAVTDVISLSLAATGDTVTGVVGGPINLVGVETLTINTLGGDDLVSVNNVGAASDLDFVTLTLGGEAGDMLTVSGTANDDRIVYTPTSAAGGTFFSESGTTQFSFTQGAAATSTFTIIGLTSDGDEVVVQGTNSHDVITIDSPTRTVTVENSAGVALKSVTLGISVESVTAEGRLGNDTFLVIPSRRQPVAPADVPVGAGFTLPTNLLVNIDGGAPGASDALVVAGPGGVALASDLFVVINRGRQSDEGVVRVFQDQPGAGNEPFQFPDISYTDVEVVSPVTFVNAAGDPNLLVLGPDLYEQNEFRANAAFLGVGSSINVVNVSIFPNAFEHRFVVADQDFFRVVAQQTGTLDFQVYFNELSEFLPGQGNLQIEVLDADGTVIAGGGPNFGTNDGAADFSTDDERIRIPVVAGQTYYLRVFGLLNATVNAYSIAVVNEAPPVPFDIELDDFVATSAVATGVSPTQFNAGAGLSNVNGYYNGKFLTFTSGPLAGQRALIATYTAATQTFTFAAGSFSGTPLAGDTFLVESGDTGRSQFENTTRDNTPTIFLRLDDASLRNDLPGNGTPGAPPDEVIPIPFNPSTDPASLVPGFRVAVYDETDTHNPVLLGFAQPVVGQPGVYMFTFNSALADGSHFISARVQIIDPASPTQRGFGGRSLSAEIVVDTAAPTVFFGSQLVTVDGLSPASDSGVVGFPATFADRITNDTTPTLFGVAEANSIVRLYADRNANGVVDLGDVFLGQTVAVPLDGSNQLPGGQWSLTTSVDLNDPSLFAHDGTRRLLVTAEDLAGNVSSAAALNLFIDTQGPQITNVSIPSDPFFDLFDPKPSQDGATPLVFSLAIDVRDLPNRDTVNFPGYLALIQQVAQQPGHYLVRGDKVGVIAVQSVQVIFGPDLNGVPATATIVLNFASPLPDDRYTLTISDTITDPASNALDGENNAVQPLESPDFPTGDGTPRGNFVARFTVDSRPEIGTYAGTRVYLDTNGNFVFDPTGNNNDAVNRDIVYTFGSTSDQIFSGKFGAAPLTGRFFDQLAAYGQFGGSFRWLIDLNSDGVVDINNIQPTPINGVAVAGNFDLNLANGDEIGLFDGSNWYRDLNRNFVIEPNEGRIGSNMQGYPIVGDFDGDGRDDLATFNNNVFTFDLASNGLSGNADASVSFGFPGVSERPVAADMDQDGIDDIGLWVPGNLGQTDAQTTEWHFLVSNDRNPGDGLNDRVIGTVNTLNHSFTPVPFGADLFAQFGDEPAFPVVGNFDPPIISKPAPSALSNDIIVTAAGAGSTPRVRVLDHETGQEKFSFLAYSAGFTGGVNVAIGDVNGDGVLDIITAAGPTGGPHVRVFDGRNGLPMGGAIGSFFAYTPLFTGGVQVASADINGDGKADIITAPGAGGGPHIRIFSGADGSLLGEYFAYSPGFTGGVNIAVGDVDGNGVPDVITGAGAGGGPHVRVFSGTSSEQIAGPLGSFFAYNPFFTGGVYVAAGDVNGDGRADLVTGAGAGGGPHVIAYNAANGAPITSFMAYTPLFTGGVRVATVDLNRDGRADIVTAAGSTGGPHVRGFSGLTAQPVMDQFVFEPSFTGGVFVAGAPSSIGGSPLHAAAAAPAGSVAANLSDIELQQILAAAISRWDQSGLSPAQVERLRGVDVRLADLPGAYLGLAYDDAILIDANAADYGWFVDATPEQDEEFSSDDLGLALNAEARQQIDLLSVLAHELGHVLGLDDLDHTLDPRQVMADELAAGMRRVPSTGHVDDVFASDDWQ
jgi:hypothetical protein